VGPTPVSRFPYERVGDAELLEALQVGDGEAAGVLWDRYAPIVRQVLRSSLGSADSGVEDLVQETFIVRRAPSDRTWCPSPFALRSGSYGGVACADGSC
jgi:hypothetical protein